MCRNSERYCCGRLQDSSATRPGWATRCRPQKYDARNSFVGTQFWTYRQLWAVPHHGRIAFGTLFEVSGEAGRPTYHHFLHCAASQDRQARRPAQLETFVSERKVYRVAVVEKKAPRTANKILKVPALLDDFPGNVTVKKFYTSVLKRSHER